MHDKTLPLSCNQLIYQLTFRLPNIKVRNFFRSPKQQQQQLQLLQHLEQRQTEFAEDFLIFLMLQRIMILFAVSSLMQTVRNVPIFVSFKNIQNQLFDIGIWIQNYTGIKILSFLKVCKTP